MRLGGYNVWEKSPGANFHGALDELRLYRGTLTDAQVTALAGQAKACPDGGQPAK